MGVRRPHCGETEPVWFGVNPRTCTPLLHTNTAEKNHGCELFVQMDHLHIQLGERRNWKTQKYFLSSILSSHSLPIFGMKTTLTAYNPILLCAWLVTVEFASKLVAQGQSWTLYRDASFKYILCVTFKYFLWKRIIGWEWVIFSLFEQFSGGIQKHLFCRVLAYSSMWFIIVPKWPK